MQTRTRQVEYVTLELRKMLMAGEFPPGQRIGEIALAERLNVSRTPVRLALGILERDGLLISEPRRGFTVRPFTVEEIVDAFEIRGVLEGLATRRCAEQGVTDQLLGALEGCIAEGDRLLTKTELEASFFSQWASMNSRFHDQIANAVPSSPLNETLSFNSRWPLVGPNSMGFRSEDTSVSIRPLLEASQVEHRAIVDALSKRQGARAEAVAREHVYMSMERTRARLIDMRGRQDEEALPLLRLVVG